MEKKYIKKNSTWLFVGCVFLPIIIIAFVIGLRYSKGDFVNAILPLCLLCIPLMVVASFMIMMPILWRISFTEDKVMIRNMFGVTKTYTNEELKVMIKNARRHGTERFYIYKGEKRITRVTMYDKNVELITNFKNREKEKYKYY